MVAGNATPLRTKPADDANQVAEHPQSLTWQPFATIFDPARHISADGIEHDQSQLRAKTGGMENHQDQCGGNDL